jgi:hypothetical protein
MHLLMLGVLSSSLRDAPSVNKQPSMSLLQWRILELADGDRVLAGVLPERPTLRITTAVEAHQGRRFVTSTGRIYQLVGTPGSDPGILCCIAQQLLLLGYRMRSDVTEEHWNAIQAEDDGAQQNPGVADG